MLAFLKPASAGETTVDHCGLFVLVVLVIDSVRRGFSNCTVSPALGSQPPSVLAAPDYACCVTDQHIPLHRWPSLAAVGREAGLADASPAIEAESNNRLVLEPHGTTCGRPGAGGWEKGDRERGRVRECSDKHQSTPGAGTDCASISLGIGMASSIASPCLSIQIDAVHPRPHATNKSHPVSSAGGMANSHNSHPRFPAAARHDADCHAGHAGSLVPGSGLHTGGVAKPPSLGSAGGDGGAAIRQATRLRVLSALVPILSAEGAGAPANPPPMSRKEALGLMFVCLSLLLAPPGPKENRTSDEEFLKMKLAIAPFSPEHAMRQNHEVGRAWSRRHQRRLVLRFSVGSASGHPSSQPAFGPCRPPFRALQVGTKLGGAECHCRPAAFGRIRFFGAGPWAAMQASWHAVR